MSIIFTRYTHTHQQTTRFLEFPNTEKYRQFLCDKKFTILITIIIKFVIKTNI